MAFARWASELRGLTQASPLLSSQTESALRRCQKTWDGRAAWAAWRAHSLAVWPAHLGPPPVLTLGLSHKCTWLPGSGLLEASAVRAPCLGRASSGAGPSDTFAQLTALGTPETGAAPGTHT